MRLLIAVLWYIQLGVDDRVIGVNRNDQFSVLLRYYEALKGEAALNFPWEGI